MSATEWVDLFVFLHGSGATPKSMIRMRRVFWSKCSRM